MSEQISSQLISGLLIYGLFLIFVIGSCLLAMLFVINRRRHQLFGISKVTVFLLILTILGFIVCKLGYYNPLPQLTVHKFVPKLHEIELSYFGAAIALCGGTYLFMLLIVWRIWLAVHAPSAFWGSLLAVSLVFVVPLAILRCLPVRFCDESAFCMLVTKLTSYMNHRAASHNAQLWWVEYKSLTYDLGEKAAHYLPLMIKKKSEDPNTTAATIVSFIPALLLWLVLLAEALVRRKPAQLQS